MDSTQLIDKQLIELNVHAQTKHEALKKVADVAYANGRVTDSESYYNGLLKRERESTTGFGSGIAIPHAKIDEVLKPSICIVKLDQPVEWESLDDKPVQLIIALAVPTQQEGTLHLQLLATLSENLMEEDFVDALLSAETEIELYNIINNIF